MHTVKTSKSQSKSISIVVAFTVTIGIFWVYFLSPHSALADPIWAIHMSSSLLNSGDIYLDEFEPLMEKTTFYGTSPKISDTHLVPYFPYGNSITILPIMWVIERTQQQSGEESFYEYLQQTSPYDSYVLSIQRLTASIVAAFAVLVMYVIARKQYGGLIVPVVSAIVLGLGTNTYAIASRVLWQHGPSLLMLAIVLYLFILGEQKPRYIQLSGFFLAFSYIIRPTNSISILVFSILILLRYRKQMLGYLMGAMIVAIPFIWSSIVVFGRLFPPYFTPQRLLNSPYFFEALLGNLVSPSRGLFFFTPVLLFSCYGVYLKLRYSRVTVTDTAVIIIIIIHWIAISSLGHWWGGYSFGPRFFTDMMPFMTYLLLPVIKQARSFLSLTQLQRGLIIMFGICAFASIWIQYQGATDSGTSEWNKFPVNVDLHPSERLWDWSDPQFLRKVEDMPLVTSPVDIAINYENYQPMTSFSLTISNNANEDMYWSIRVPPALQIKKQPNMEYRYLESGLQEITGKQPLSGQALQTVSFSVDVPLITPNDFSLGAIIVSTQNSEREEEVIQIISLSVPKNGYDWEQQFALNPLIWLPTDIFVNGEKPRSDLYGFFGAGWYLSESFDVYQWRWAQSPAELYIFSARTQNVTLDLKPVNIFDDAAAENGLGKDGILQVTVNNQLWVGEIVQDQVQQVPVALKKGWNVVLFDLQAGNFQPIQFNAAAGDTRDLSFAFAPININTP